MELLRSILRPEVPLEALQKPEMTMVVLGVLAGAAIR
jgi:hypothetical protein